MTINGLPPHLGGENVAAEAVDLDGATVGETGPEHTADEVVPDADLNPPARDTDGTPVGAADADADAH